MTNVVSDSVKRLRAANTWLNEGDCCGQLDASGTCMAPACIFGEALKMTNEAADRIEQLEAELTIQYQDGHHDGYEKGCTISKEASERYDRINARIEQLEAALRTISLMDKKYEHDLFSATCVARAALEERT